MRCKIIEICADIAVGPLDIDKMGAGLGLGVVNRTQPSAGHRSLLYFNTVGEAVTMLVGMPALHIR